MRFVLLSFLIAGMWFAIGATSERQHSRLVDTYTFTNTSSWDPTLLSFATEPLKLFPDWESYLTLPPPPANSSLETREELEKMLRKKGLRTPETIEQINSELSMQTIMIGGHAMSDYFDTQKYPDTARLFTDSYHDMSVIVLLLKQKFDRVRPHILEPDIKPVIDVPRHPAYPSGHSTQSHFMAYLLAEIWPERRTKLEAEADQIALNREIAGVHYESDSKAGELLARQFVDLLLIKPEIIELIKSARIELGK